MKLSIEAPDDEVVLPGEVHLHLRFRPANMVGILLVLLIHGVLLYFLLQMQVLKKQKQGDEAASQNPITLVLNKVTIAKMAAPVPKKAPPKAAKPPAIPHTRKSITPPAPVPPVDAPSPIVQAPPPVTQTEAPDMMSMLKAARERRRAEQEAAAQENQASRGMSAQEVAEANVRHSMQMAAGRDGTSGVFQIISMSTRVGSFSFRGWKPNANSSWKQVIEVDAGLGGNLELAMVRRMIELIRTHYQGDFSWESHKLGRVIVLSARPQDSAELEAFMMKEFFGQN